MIVSESRVLEFELKQNKTNKKREHPRERWVLKGPQRLGQCGQAARETGRTFVLQISSVRASHSKKWLLQAGQGGEGEPMNKGGLSVGLRLYFVKAAFMSFLKDGSISSLPQATVQETGGPDPRLPDSLDPLALLGLFIGVLSSKCHVDVHVCYARARPLPWAAVAFLGGPRQVT